VQTLLPLMVTTPSAQSAWPLHPAKVEPESAVALSVTVGFAPGSALSLQSPEVDPMEMVQLIPVPVTVPLPVPAPAMVRVTTTAS
jgi:hypothetical protein